jgi:hypothetical protein
MHPGRFFCFFCWADWATARPVRACEPRYGLPAQNSGLVGAPECQHSVLHAKLYGRGCYRLSLTTLQLSACGKHCFGDFGHRPRACSRRWLAPVGFLDPHERSKRLKSHCEDSETQSLRNTALRGESVQIPEQSAILFKVCLLLLFNKAADKVLACSRSPED